MSDDPDRGDKPRGSSVEAPHEPRGLSPQSGLGLPTLLHVGAFAVCLSVWTWKLLEPYPVPEPVKGLLSGDMSFYAAKSLHAVGYAILAVLAATMPVAPRWRWRLVALVALHGVATEILQAVLPFNRTGRVADVLIDWAGVAAGLLALRWWRVSREPQASAAPPRSPSGRG